VKVHTVWGGEHRFDIGRPGGVAQRIDADAKTGPGPVDALLGALTSCAGVDVVDILAKQRTPVHRMTIDAVGTRAHAVPARFVHIALTFHIDGPGIERAAAERAVDLAVNKYCSVRSSLDPAIPVEWRVLLNGT
jgi:putative redox protein